ncbi:chromate efflux transporter [Pseudomonas sp. JDS28PS106]|uniref:chromate efflux transporter n=1 Tax=Pseudomonas sp. JDS28PS106 TaxID=2497235 RepID=UPI002FD27916
MPPNDKRHTLSIFLIFLRLGLTSFGGPVAHLAFFRDEFVVRRSWLSESSYAELVALCQFLPGPASSQVGMALGMSRGGYRGALAAWAGFTLPSAIILTLLALGMTSNTLPQTEGIVKALKLMTVAVVVQAVYGMARQHCASFSRAVLMLIACGWVISLPQTWAQVAVMIGAALAGIWLFKPTPIQPAESLPIPLSTQAGARWLGVFFLLLIGLPLLGAACTELFSPGSLWAQIEVFYRVGALVFGGGHVVLPLLQGEVVDSGWIASDSFVAGYGAAQAMPGPLFSFAAFVGAAMNADAGTGWGWAGALICLSAMFAPSFLLIAGVLPFWANLRVNPTVRAALIGVNAAVVGLLLAALYRPVWASAVDGLIDVAFVLLGLIALIVWKRPPWQVVLASVVVGWFAG